MAKADRACSSARALLDLSDAREMVAQAETFVAAMRVGFMPNHRSTDTDGFKP
jgi:hypothetical protein